MTSAQALPYIRALPRLRAEEKFEQIAAMQIAFGTMDKDKARSILNGWRKQSEGSGRRQRMQRGEYVHRAAAFGIKVTHA